MPIDQFDPGTSNAQQFPAQEPDKLRRLWQIIAAQKRQMFDLRASVLANVSDIVADLTAQVAATAAATAAVAAAQITLTAQQATLTAQQATLTAQQATLTAQQATLTAQQATLTATVADLASRVSVTASIASFATGSLPNDNVMHDYGADIPITIAVPTGKLTVTVGCGQANMGTGGTGAVGAQATFSISGGIANYGDVYAWGSISYPTQAGGMPLSVQCAFTVPPGTYTITGKMRAQTAVSTAAVYFSSPYLTVQVTG